MAESASIRFNNPGAMWDGKVSYRWGSKQSVILTDGQSNHIAIFPSTVQGAAAQFDLWRSNYTGMSLKDAVKKWCGGNSPANYLKFLKDAGIPGNALITPALLAGPVGLKLMKAQAQWEAGKVYPMTDFEWSKAQSMVFKSSVTKTAGAVILIGSAAAAGAHPVTSTWIHGHWPFVLAGVVAVAIGFAIYLTRK
jgi:hypothetical protein